MSTSDSIIVLVPKKGSTLPVGECVLVKENPEAYIVKAASKTGRGRGVKTVLRQYVLPKSEVAYLYQEREISPEEAAKYPSSNGVKPGVRAAPVAKADKPAKRGPGRPKKDATAKPVKRGPGRPKAADATAEADKPAKRGPGRPKKAKAAAKADKSEKSAKPAKRGPGRPKTAKTEAKADKPAKRGPGRPKTVEAAAKASKPEKPAKPAKPSEPAKRGPGRPKKADVAKTEAAETVPFTAETAPPPADPPAKKGGSSLFTDFGA